MADEGRKILTIREALAAAATLLRESGIAEARREAGSLLMHVLGRDRAFLFAHDDEEFGLAQLAQFDAWVGRRAAGEPLQYITGRQEFYRLPFEVTPDVLIPRPETELLIETALELLRGSEAPLICDVGTGSGCIAVTLLHELPDASGYALDISGAALEVARRNAVRHGVAGRLKLLVSDCFDALEHETGAAPAPHERERFTMVVSNPPYVAERDLSGLQREVRDHEPRVALTPGGDGLSVIRRLVAEAPRYLAAGGHLLLEIGFNQHGALREMIDPRIWTLLDIHRDLQGIPRTVALRLRS